MGLFDFFKKKQVPKPTTLVEAMRKEDDFGGVIEEPMTMVPMDMNDSFVQHKVTFDKILRPGEQIPVEWVYAPGMTREQIEDIIPACTCTASITWGKVGVRAIYTHQEKNVPPEGKFYTKTMTVYFKDGYGKVSDGRGGMMYDPAKKRRVLSFTGKLMP